MHGKCIVIFLGIFINLSVTSECPSDTKEENVGCVAIGDEQNTNDAIGKTRCYYLYKQQKWNSTNASKICSCHGKASAGAMSEDARIVVSDVLKNLSPPQSAWLMGYKEISPSWVNSQMVAMETSNLINKRESQECGYLIKEGSDVQLKPESCSANLKVICQKDSCASTDVDCLDIRSDSDLSWFDSRYSCKKSGQDILSFQTNNDLSRLSGSLQSDVKYWVGIRKAIWRWNETTEIEQFNWAPNEPTSKGETCLALTPEGRWEDVKCSEPRYALCWQDENKTSKRNISDIPAIVGGVAAAVIGCIIIILIIVAVLLRRKRRPISESDIENIRRKTHRTRRDTEVRTIYGVRFSDISDNLNFEENNQGL